MPALPSIIMQLDMDAGPVATGPVSDGIFGQLLLLGVGRMLIPFALSPWVVRFLSLWH